MQHLDFRIASPADGTPLAGIWVLPDIPTRAVVQFHHGMCEHKERYLPFMEYLAQNGFACVIHDCRGHGESLAVGEGLGYFGKNGGPAVVEDLYAVTCLARERFPGIPVLLFGHSMGSLAVRAYTKCHDDAIDALVVCGCPSRPAGTLAGNALVSRMEKHKGGRSHSRLMDGLVLGGYQKAFPKEGKSAWLSSDPKAVAAYEADPLCGFSFTLNGYAALLYLTKTAYDPKGWQTKNPRLPVLFVSGAEDPCRISDEKFQEAICAMRHAGYQNTHGKLYPGMRHEILGEPRREDVFRDILTFFEQCITPR